MGCWLLVGKTQVNCNVLFLDNQRDRVIPQEKVKVCPTEARGSKVLISKGRGFLASFWELKARMERGPTQRPPYRRLDIGQPTIPHICHFFTQAKILDRKIYTKERVNYSKQISRQNSVNCDLLAVSFVSQTNEVPPIKC